MNNTADVDFGTGGHGKLANMVLMRCTSFV
jgi:hypothetical protein